MCVAARLAGVVALGALDRLFRISPDFAARFPLLEARANRYYPVLRGTVSTIISAVAALVLLEVWGIDVLRWFDYARTQVPGLYEKYVGRPQQIEVSGEDQPSFPLFSRDLK